MVGPLVVAGGLSGPVGGMLAGMLFAVVSRSRVHMVAAVDRHGLWVVADWVVAGARRRFALGSNQVLVSGLPDGARRLLRAPAR